MSRSSDVLRFTRADPAVAVAALGELAVARDGWVNLQPEPDDDEPAGAPVRAGVLNLFSGRGPRLPVATWVPGEDGGRHPEPDSLGLQHGAGPKAVIRLREAGIGLPEGASVLSDHARRGLVLAVPRGTPPGVLVEWSLRAAEALSPEPLPQSWLAVVHRR